MALGYNIVGRGAVGDMWLKIVDLTFDASYAAGGYALSAKSLGLGTNGVILAVIPVGSRGGFFADYNQGTGALMVRDASGTAGAASPEVPNNAAAISGVVQRCLVLGKGSPG